MPQNNLLFSVVFLRGGQLKYIKTTEDGLLTIYNALEDTEHVLKESDGDTWQSNIESGRSYEAMTESQIRNTISEILKI